MDAKAWPVRTLKALFSFETHCFTSAHIYKFDKVQITVIWLGPTMLTKNRTSRG